MDGGKAYAVDKGRKPGQHRARPPRRRLSRPAVTLAVIAAAGAVTLAVGLTAAVSAGSPGGPAEPTLLSGSIGGNKITYLEPHQTIGSGTVVASGTGYTLYWFSRDTPTYTACDDVCVPQWPPVTGAPQLAAGTKLPGQLGTMRRSDGVEQATYDGHPLYTFAGDFEPGDVGGNNVVQFGGTWHVVRPG
jgi:predicted lipoprotein with Yx(FWY)xxD motif